MEPIDSVRVGYSNLKRAAKQIAQTTCKNGQLQEAALNCL